MEKNVEVPLPEFIREAAREAARTVIREHVESCAVVKYVEKLDQRIKSVEDEFKVFSGRFNYVLGAIVGSGALGGTVGAVIMNFFGGS